MTILSETVDATINDYKEVRKIVEELTLDEVTEILDRRRTPANPTETWQVWQNELTRWQNLLRTKQGYKKRFSKLLIKFKEIKEEEMDVYGYMSLGSQEWLFNTTRELFSKLEDLLYG